MTWVVPIPILGSIAMAAGCLLVACERQGDAAFPEDSADHPSQSADGSVPPRGGNQGMMTMSTPRPASPSQRPR